MTTADVDATTLASARPTQATTGWDSKRGKLAPGWAFKNLRFSPTTHSAVATTERTRTTTAAGLSGAPGAWLRHSVTPSACRVLAHHSPQRSPPQYRKHQGRSG